MTMHRLFLSLFLATCFVCSYSSVKAFLAHTPVSSHLFKSAELISGPSMANSRMAGSSVKSRAADAVVDMNPYHYSKVKDDQYDTIVIGSGIGGLSAASMLAQHGQRVLVLEQHYVAGGACHTFSRKGYSFGTGIHYVGDAGELLPGKTFNLRTILNKLTGNDDQVEWDRMNDQAETVTIGDPTNRFPITAGSVEKYKQSLVDMFPEEEKAIEKFLEMCQKSQKAWFPATMLKVLPYPISRVFVKTGLYRVFDGGYRKFTQMTVSEALEDLTDNKDLRAILASNFVDFGLEPGRAPFLIQAAVHNCYWNGSYYPRGGPSSIPKKVIKNIIAHGGKVFTKASVKNILVDDDGKTVNGVEMNDGSTIHAKTIVSDVGLHTTATKLLPPGLIDVEYGERDKRGDSKMHPSCSGVNLFIGLKGSPSSLNLPKGINWMYPSNDLSGAIDRLRELSLEEALRDLTPRDLPMIVSIPCTTDREWDQTHPNKSVLEILMLVPWHWFEKFTQDFLSSSKGHGAEYEEAKMQLAKLMWSRVVEILGHASVTLPHNLDDVDLCEVATPLTFERFYQADHGGWYGIEIDKNRMEPENYFLKLRPKVHGVEGLFLTGQDVMTMGIEPCALSGVMCAATVLGHKGNPFAMLATNNESNQSAGRGEDWPAEGAAPAH